jgi:hypothetical protein
LCEDLLKKIPHSKMHPKPTLVIRRKIPNKFFAQFVMALAVRVVGAINVMDLA